MRRLLIHFTLCWLLKKPSQILLYRYGLSANRRRNFFRLFSTWQFHLTPNYRQFCCLGETFIDTCGGKCSEWWTGKCVGGHTEDSFRTFAWKGRNCYEAQLETRHRDLQSKNLSTISNHCTAHSVTWQCSQFGTWLDFLLSCWIPWFFAVGFPALPSNCLCHLLLDYFTLIIIIHLCHLGLGL